MFQSLEWIRSTRKRHRAPASRVQARQRFVPLLSLSLLALMLSACSLYTTRPIQANATPYNQFNQKFDPTTYVNSIWSSKVVPTIVAKAADLPTLLAALKKDEAAAEKHYAVSSSDGSYNFMVSGQGTITAVDTASRAGIVTVRVPGVSSQTTIILQVGPVISGMALRDSVGFIDYTQFSNQVQFAEISDQLNTHAAKNLQSVPFSTLKGQKITFYGAFTLLDLQHISIVPVKIVTGGGN